jgi:hypothetical protein
LLTLPFDFRTCYRFTLRWFGWDIELCLKCSKLGRFNTKCVLFIFIKWPRLRNISVPILVTHMPAIKMFIWIRYPQFKCLLNLSLLMCITNSWCRIQWQPISNYYLGGSWCHCSIINMLCFERKIFVTILPILLTLHMLTFCPFLLLIFVLNLNIVMLFTNANRMRSKSYISPRPSDLIKSTSATNIPKFVGCYSSTNNSAASTPVR